MLDLNNILFLAVIYIVAFGLGLLISKFWIWFRILILFFLFKWYFSHFNFQEINLAVFLVLIVPACIIIYPSLFKMFALDSSPLNPFRWILGKKRAKRYKQRRETGAKMDQNELDRLERLLRMQAEEAEKQRQFEREKAEWEAKRRTEQKETPKKSTAHVKNDPYEVLGLERSADLEEARKAYAELAKKYHPDRVNHLGLEFQDMAHQKYMEIKDAWEKIQRDRKA